MDSSVIDASPLNKIFWIPNQYKNNQEDETNMNGQTNHRHIRPQYPSLYVGRGFGDEGLAMHWSMFSTPISCRRGILTLWELVELTQLD